MTEAIAAAALLADRSEARAVIATANRVRTNLIWEHTQAAIRLHRVADALDHVAPRAQLATTPTRQLQQRLGVVLGNRGLAHYCETLRLPSCDR